MTTTIVKMKLPDQLSKLVGRIEEIEFEGNNVLDFINHLEQTYGNISNRLLDRNMESTRPYINIYLGKTNIEKMDGLTSKVYPGDRISILLSRAGG